MLRRRAALAWVLGALVGIASGVPGGSATAATGPFHLDVTLVGDLDRDGLADVVEAEWAPTAAGSVTNLTARRGRDGHRLWTQALPGLNSLVPARVGPSGERGMVAFDDNTTNPLALSALTRTGVIVWTRRLDPPPPTADGSAQWLVYPVANLAGGPADDVFAAWVNFSYGTQDLFVVDGANGEVVSLGSTPLVWLPGLAPTFPSIVGDLSGDGRADIVEMAPGTAASVVRAIRGEDGSSLWSVAVATTSLSLFPVPVGDLSGDGRADVALVVPVQSSSLPVRSEVRVLSGVDGSTLWSRPGSMVHPLGDIDGDRRADVGIATLVSEPGRRELTLAAYSATGVLRYEQSVPVPAPSGDPGTDTVATYVTDTRGDGRRDVVYQANFGQPAGNAWGVVDGRTGRILHAHVGTGSAEPKLVSAVDGRGADFAYRTRTPGAFGAPSRSRLAVYAGDTGSTLWYADVADLGGYLLGVAAGRMTTDRCADVLVRSNVSGGQYAVLDGANGRVRWGRRLGAMPSAHQTGFTPGPDRNAAC